ncbi:hypothetical protein [Myroides odoratus]
MTYETATTAEVPWMELRSKGSHSIQRTKKAQVNSLEPFLYL